MKYTAVIFDLFGTLVDSYSLLEFDTLLREMAKILGIPRMDFIKNWVQEAKASMGGLAPTPVDSVHKICTRTGVRPSSAAIAQVLQLRLQFERHIMLNPRPDALDMLRILKIEGYKLGLISNCTLEAPQIWPETPMAEYIDVPLFSSLAKIKKPDPRIYSMATTLLQVTPKDCLYIGDGSSRELSGARDVGMLPIQVQIQPGEEVNSYSLVQEIWDGEIITSFYELISILQLPRRHNKYSVLYEI